MESRRLAFLLFAAFASAACRSAVSTEPVLSRTETEDAGNPSPQDASTARVDSAAVGAGRSVEGRAIEVLEFGEASETVLFLATIHGDEPAGTPLLRAFADELTRQPELTRNRRAVLVPLLNPDGFAADRRSNARGVDLNRNFPSANHRRGRSGGGDPLSEPESRLVAELLATYDPLAILSFHQAARCIDYDGPAAALAARLAACSELPVDRLGARAGSLGSYAGEDQGRATVTVELPAGAERLDEATLLLRYGPMLRAALSFPAEDLQRYEEAPERP